MSTRRDDRDGFTEADRRAIADIRRELDAEFGALEAPDMPAGRFEQPVTRHTPPPLRPEPTVRRAARRVRSTSRWSLSAFLLGALIGGIAGGVTGGATAYLWLQSHGDLRRLPTRSAVPTVGSPATATPAQISDHGALDTALSDWLEAMRRGDIEGQMHFYPPRVAVYYTWRDVPRSAVRDEKLKVFGAATTLQIATDAPSIERGGDGRSVVTRFGTRYVIDGPVIRRHGEVVQELRWTRMADGWRIIAERDAEVLAP